MDDIPKKYPSGEKIPDEVRAKIAIEKKRMQIEKENGDC
jgi:hypothetical protein